MAKVSRLLPSGLFLGLLLGLMATVGPGCSKSDWIPEQKPASYKAEITNLPSHEALYFKKLNEDAWTNVTFIINKDYIFSVTEIGPGQREFMIDYAGFRHKSTEEPMPSDVEIWRIWVEGDEGYWY